MADSTALVGSALVGQARVGSLGATPPAYLRTGGGCWKLIHDPAIGDIADTLEGWTSDGGLIDQLRADVDGQVDWWYQATTPVGAKPGDYWIPAEGPMQVLTATGWEDVSDPRIEAALEAAGTAQATADGKVTTYGGATEPAGTVEKPLGEGDLWVRDGDARLHVYRSGSWVLVDEAAITAAEQAAKDYTDQQQASWLDTAATAAQDKADAAQAEAVRLAGIASTEKDEALEAALGDLVADKSNVFIQDSAPVAEMQRPGVLWIDTTPVTIDGAQVPGNIPKTWDSTAWVALTDSAVVQAAAEAAAAHQAAEAAATAAGDAMAEARYAPRIAQRPPVQADGVDKPAGAGWLEYATTTNYQGITADRLVQQWMWTGTTWVRLDMDPTILPVVQIGTGTFGDLTGDRIAVTGLLAARMAEIIELSVEHLTVVEGATISEAVAIAISGATLDYQEAYLHNLRVDGSATIDEAVIGALASNIITSGLFRTAEFGQRLEIDSNGLIMYGTDPDGVDYEMVRLGPSGDQLLTIGSSTISEEVVSAPRGEFTDLTIGGEDLATMLAPLPRGLLGRMAMYTNSDYSNATDQPRLRLNVDVEAGRAVEVTVPPFYTQTQAAAAVTWILTATANRLDNGAALGTVQLDSGRHSNPDSNLHTVAGSTAHLPDYPAPVRVAITLATSMSGSGTGVRTVAGSATPLLITAIDQGPYRANVGTRWTYGNLGDGSGGSSGGGTGGSTPVAQRYVGHQWDAAGYGGDTSAGDVVQGYYASVGMRYGGWIFPGSMKTSLAGSTIERFEIYLKNSHWYFGAGGTASIRPNNGQYKGTVFGGTQHLVSGWPRYQGRWVTLPSSWYPHIAAGTYGGISLQTSSTSGTYYGRFRGDAFRTRVTYRR